MKDAMSETNNRLRDSVVNLSQLGLGIEHFARGVRKITHLSRDENSKQIIEEAYKLGLTHFDIVFNLPYFFDLFREFVKDKREKITFTTHLGSFYDDKKNGHIKTRSLKKIQFTYEDMLSRLDVDYADIALVQFVTHFEDYEKVINNGILEYAQKMKSEGRAKAVGLSSHKPELLLKIIEKSDLDVIMMPINFATGILDSTKKLLEECKKKGIAVIAIKNLLKGKAFTTKRTDYPAYFCAGKKFTMTLDKPATPADCFQYAIDLGVDSVVFGVKTIDELRTNIESFESNTEKANYNNILVQFEKTVLT